ncbi:hypothetical protein J8273_4620 [Carpediemonas membranifera]|uniref:Uncharacterized protein n=1 Tax=Carpediemonas membranifera TaxID=201153 RepID=A0A8J6AXL7_9EUKA|nr:hypothetical protein J8273_4620 [Carpediemonas membranifera]|eukprot:KAG9394020.1 hypothetical protein J8273_4620 [Carpediemonas membranifera]
MLQSELRVYALVDELEEQRPHHVGQDHLANVLEELCAQLDSPPDDLERFEWFEKGVIAEIEAANPRMSGLKVVKDFRLMLLRRGEIEGLKREIESRLANQEPSDTDSPRPALSRVDSALTNAEAPFTPPSQTQSPTSRGPARRADSALSIPTSEGSRRGELRRYPYMDTGKQVLVSGVNTDLLTAMIQSPVAVVRSNIRRTGMLKSFLRLSADVNRIEFLKTPDRSTPDAFVTISRIERAGRYRQPAPPLFLNAGYRGPLIEIILSDGTQVLVGMGGEYAGRWVEGLGTLLRYKHRLFKLRVALKGLEGN